MKKIIFFADGHSYWLDSQGVLADNRIPKDMGVIKQIPSVGSVYGKYFPEFQRDYWLTHGAFKRVIPEKTTEVWKSVSGFKKPAEELFVPLFNEVNGTEFFSKRDELSQFWDFKRQNSAFWGTRFHEEREQQARDQGFMINPWTDEKFKHIDFNPLFDNESRSMNLFDLQEGYHSEVLVFDLDLWVAGQVDQLFIKKKGKKKLAWIGDFKSNESKPETSSMDMCFPPIEHLNASTHTKYSMQISMYAYILQRAGFEIQEIGYTHYKNYDPNRYENVKVEPFFPEIEKLFQKTYEI